MKVLIDLNDYSEEIRLGIIKETTDKDLIDYARLSDNENEKAAVALNATISVGELDILSTSSSGIVKENVLRNKKTAGVTIDNMLTDEEATPHENLMVNHPNVWKETLERFLKHHTDKNLRIVAEQRLKYM